MFNNLSCGIGYGFIAAVIIFSVLDQIRQSRRKMGQLNRTLDTFSEAEQSHLTSAQVVRNSTIGMANCVFWIIILVALIILLVQVAFYIASFN